ncbi:glycosyltransferase family 4 protein [Methylobacter sp. G7]|uniref:glycosyltransferase family 4 protein n=1 Tax=Methylobacter sp. G7 TaxID=3230117 RepID=UPI003D809263
MIAIVYPQFYGIGGIARYLDSFLSNLPTDHPPVYLITSDEHRVERHYPGVKIIHFPYNHNRFSLFFWSLRARNKLINLYDEGKIQWINLHYPPLIPGLFLPRHIPVMLTVHSTYLGFSGNFYPKKFYDSEISWLTLKIKMWMESRIYKNSSRTITLTEFGREQILAYGYDKPIHIIPNGVDLNQFKFSSDNIKNIDVLFTGRIEHLKGSKGMVEICRRLVEKKKDILIYIVGYGEEENWVRQQLGDLKKNVIMTGKVPFAEMIIYYNRSRVYVSTSYYEGLPGTCLEAMAMQLPAVVWDFLFYRGLVVEGQTGSLAAPNDFAEMTDKVLTLLSNPRLAAEMGENGRVLLESDYNWGKLAPDVLAVFAKAG